MVKHLKSVAKDLGLTRYSSAKKLHLCKAIYLVATGKPAALPKRKKTSAGPQKRGNTKKRSSGAPPPSPLSPPMPKRRLQRRRRPNALEDDEELNKALGLIEDISEAAAAETAEVVLPVTALPTEVVSVDNAIPVRSSAQRNLLLRSHQLLIQDAFSHPDCRGMVLYHAIRKTITSIAAVEAAIAASHGAVKRVHVVVPASLVPNFKEELDNLAGHRLVARKSLYAVSSMEMFKKKPPQSCGAW